MSNSNPTATILVFGTDLLFGTRIRTTAEVLGLDCRPIREPGQVAAIEPGGRVSALIVDLSRGDESIDAIRRFRSANPQLPILAFGSHVDVAGMAEAGEAGAGEVLPRSRFSQQLPDVLRRLARIPD